ncbi:hypothetical protein JCM9492_06080 [Aquifex pyrophilus]
MGIVIRTYKMTNDKGFAPNPFHGYLILATCKPGIRRKAEVGEWICGFDSKKLSGSPSGKERLVYVMKVEEKLSFDEYYEDPRFQIKKPSAGEESIYILGDNIYYRGKKVEKSPFHRDEPDQREDLSGEYVLISSQFWYFGRCSVEVPEEVRPIVPKYSTYYGAITTGDRAKKFLDWLFKTFPKPGIYGPPHKSKNIPWEKDKNFVTALCE